MHNIRSLANHTLGRSRAGGAWRDGAALGGNWPKKTSIGVFAIKINDLLLLLRTAKASFGAWLQAGITNPYVN